MVAMQIIVLIAFMLISTADISDTRYWIEGVNLHVIPFGWSIHSTVGSIVVSATIGGWKHNCIPKQDAARIAC